MASLRELLSNGNTNEVDDEEGPDPSMLVEIGEDEIKIEEEEIKIGEEDGDQEEMEETRSLGILEQALTVKPLRMCPVCGDRANGIHYGIYTCEGCKNFFKRSVVLLNSEKPYFCKGNRDCNITLFEADGLTRRRTRCKYCRYQACLAAGMVHCGRSGRQIYGPLKQAAEPVVVSPFVIQEERQRLVEEVEKQDVQMLQSKVRELEALLEEKNNQLQIQRSQIETLKKQCKLYEDMWPENGQSNEEQHSTAFGNGGVTITRTKGRMS